MAAAKDLTGKVFGRLTVISLDPEPYVSPSGKKKRRWKCKCECGKEVTVLTNALTNKNGGTKSCGCIQKSITRSKAQDLTGKRFGRLCVEKSVDLDNPGPNGIRLGWLCKCECGKTIIATQKELVHGGLKSCGCLLSETASKKVNDENILGYFKGTTITSIQPNRPPNKNNTSGVKGVSWSARYQKWVAKIGVKGKSITIGRFKSLEDAKKARLEAEEKYFTPLIEEYNKSQEPPQE